MSLTNVIGNLVKPLRVSTVEDHGGTVGNHPMSECAPEPIGGAGDEYGSWFGQLLRTLDHVG